jgi:gliding motility-associated-like protein
MSRVLLFIIIILQAMIVNGQFMNDRLSLQLHYLEVENGQIRLNWIENLPGPDQINPYAQINDCYGNQKLALSLRDDINNFGLRNSNFEIVDGYGGDGGMVQTNLFLDRVLMRVLPGCKDTIIIFHPLIGQFPGYHQSYWAYTLVDLKANGGKGKVILYKRKFADFCSPACTVMPIPESSDFWFLSGYDSVTVRAFKVTKDGVDTQYVQSRAHNQTYRHASINSGFMNTNPELFQMPGTVIISPRHDGHGVIVSGLRRSTANTSAVIEYDFDPLRGVLSKPRNILSFLDLPENTMQASSALYSPNDTFVYATCESRRITKSITRTRYQVFQVNRFTREKQIYLSGFKDHQEQINAFTYFYNSPDGKIYLLKREVIGKPLITSIYSRLYSFERPNLPGKFAMLRKVLDTVTDWGPTMSRDAPWASRPWPYFTANSQMNACADTTVFTLGGDTALHQLVFRFGDGDSLLVQGPIAKGFKIKHHYKQNGRYPVALITWNTECNVPLWSTDTLDILKPPHSVQYSFRHQPGCLTDTLTLRFKASNHTRFRFQYPGFDSLFNALDSQLVFEYPRNKSKSLFAFSSLNPDCTVTLRDTLRPVYHPLPKANWFTSGYRSVDSGVFTACQPFLFTLTDSTSDLSQTKSGSDYGSPTTTGIQHHIVCSDTGRYRFWVSSYNSYACSITDTFRLHVLHSPFALRLPVDSILCAGQQALQVQWQAQRIPAGTKWEITDGGIRLNSLQWNRLYMSAGNYNLRLAGVANNQCAYFDTLRFKVVAAVPATFTLLSDQLCAEKQSPMVSDTLPAWQSWWLTDGRMLHGSAFAAYRYSGSGNRQIMRYTLSDQGCRDSFMRFVNVLPLPLLDMHFSDTTACRPGNTFTVEDRQLNTPAARYVWFDGNGNRRDTLAENLRLLLHWPLAGRYPSVWVKFHASGCTDTVQQTITIHKEPLVSLQFPNPLCADRPIEFSYAFLSGGPLASRKWNLNGKPDTARSFSHVFTSTGLARLQLELQNTAGCITNYDTSLLVGRAPDGQLQVSRVSAEAGASTFYFASTGNRIQRYHWNFGRGAGDTATEAIPGNRRYEGDTGTYTVRLILVSEDGCADTLGRQIILKPLLPLFWPNSFTPDGDGLNDRFEISGTGDVLQYRLRIFFRWGGQLFDSRDHTAYWDGTFKGDPVPEGVFPFLLEVQTIDGRWHRIHDRVQVIRR